MNGIPPEYLNQIITGDAHELAKRIPDESVDLIFTDPPYSREFLSLYEWLAEMAARILKPGGLCLAMCGQSFLPIIYQMMNQYLNYHWTFGMDTLGAACNIWDRRLASQWKPILSYTKDKYTGRMFGTDKISSSAIDKRFHEWGQSVSSAFYFIERLPGIVFDPFTGGGTTPAVCKMLGRNYIAFEIVPEVAERARERVRNTQPPLFVMQLEQSVMEFVEA